MSRAIDALALVLVGSAACAFGFGIHAVGEHRDLPALYLLLVGWLSLKSATEILRPRGGTA